MPPRGGDYIPIPRYLLIPKYIIPHNGVFCKGLTGALTGCIITNMDIRKLTLNIIDGYRIKRGEDLSLLLSADMDTLLACSGEIQRHFRGNHVDFCTIINARSGRCGEDCKYCAQSCYHSTGIDEYPFLPKEEIVRNAEANDAAGVNRFAVVTSGRALSGAEFEEALSAFREMRQRTNLGLCASLGLLTREQFKRLRQAGVTRYHHNIETSRRFFPEICSTHTYEDRIRTIETAKEEGFEVCSGGIIGMGETWEDRIDMAVSLAEMGIMSIPINALIAIKGTKLEGREPLSAEEILRSVALFRFVNPEADVRLAAGRALLGDGGAAAFTGGASAAITGNMLTTGGATVKDDIELMKRLGMCN